MLLEFKSSMKDKAAELSVELSERQLEQFYQYYEYMIEINEVMNLTAITEINEVIEKHFIDSISIVKAIELNKNCSLNFIDVGTGAGFPGIPLKIVFPDIKITLLDSLNKRIKFLGDVVEKLELKDITLIHGRAEDFGRDKAFREKYDFCVSRAVANLAVLSEYCMPFVKPEGFFIPYKSGKIEEELNSSKGAIKLLSGKIQKVESFQLPDSDYERSLVVIKKIEPISKKYPRKAGMPAKEPLK